MKINLTHHHFFPWRVMIPKRKKLLDFSKVGGRNAGTSQSIFNRTQGNRYSVLALGTWQMAFFISMILPTNGTLSPDLGRLQLWEKYSIGPIVCCKLSYISLSVRSNKEPIEIIRLSRLHRVWGFGAEGLNECMHACRVFGAGLGTGLRTFPSQGKLNRFLTRGNKIGQHERYIVPSVPSVPSVPKND